MPELLGAREQQAEFLVEHEQGGALAARDRRGDVLQDQQRFAGAGRTEDERARSGGDAAAEQLDRAPAMPLLTSIAGEAGAMLGGHQAREDLDAAWR